MADDIPVSVWQGSFNLLGVEVKCHKLSDGRRIIEADSMTALLDAMAGNEPMKKIALDELMRWQWGTEH